ncbi:zinc-binding dehydrogenase [Saccharopolyspora indica]|uniref:zinc-binding dehydrogenase n=1 Tax=Saccharopolyspora indica TaxID=1229659 RepID=UPI0022EADE6B|nr:zinc-binding dehydrogenase [Saccharopolyspora indica]MDA3647928.1 zinc-binding dehydrogenase [Saccharopolyspora indica]
MDSTTTDDERDVMTEGVKRRVARAVRPGGPEVIEVVEEALAAPGPGEVLVKVVVSGVNHADGLLRSGGYVVSARFPHPVGVEAAGVVAAIGPGVLVPVGTRVAGTGWLGSCADYAVVPVERLVEIPGQLSFEQAASVAHAGAAAGALTRVWPVEGRVAAVWGAAGAVGRLLVVMLARRGAEVIGIASGARVKAVQELGAAHVVDRAAGDVAEQVRAATGGRGADVVFDPVAAETFRTSLGMLAPRGCLINYGQLAGEVDGALFHELFRAGGVFVTKFNAAAYVTGYADVTRLIGEAFELAAQHPSAVVPVADRFGLADVAAAHRALDSGPAGKVLVIPGR